MRGGGPTPAPPKHAVPPPEAADGSGGERLLRQTAAGAVGPRKKGAGVRAWLLVDPTGQAQEVVAGKHSIMKRTGLPARDLRILDPALSYPSTVLGRERAIVVNLEHIKAIITAQEVIFLNWRDPLVAPFVMKLQKIFRHRQSVKSSQMVKWYLRKLERMLTTQTCQICIIWKSKTVVNPNQNYSGDYFLNKNEDGNADGGDNARGLKILPFEFVALEACLETACSSLDNEARTLEQEAYPALDKLTSKISTLNLERVRQIKSRLVAITGRVQKMRDEFEHLLDDDGDMAEMYLTEKFEQQQFDDISSASSIYEQDDIDEEITPSDMSTMAPGEVTLENTIGESDAVGKQSHRTHTSARSASAEHLDVEELEMILEAYFVQIDGTLNKLSNLREYVDDTEDYINIMLDDKQNHLLQTGVMLTTATVVVSAFVALTGVFGMNITIDLFDEDKAGMPQFLWTVVGGTAGCVFLYIAAIAWCSHKCLLEY